MAKTNQPLIYGARFNLAIEKSDLKKIKLIAKKNKTSVSELIRNIAKLLIDEHGL